MRFVYVYIWKRHVPPVLHKHVIAKLEIVDLPSERLTLSYSFKKGIYLKNLLCIYEIPQICV